jgi:acetyl esterase/lipase
LSKVPTALRVAPGKQDFLLLTERLGCLKSAHGVASAYGEESLQTIGSTYHLKNNPAMKPTRCLLLTLAWSVAVLAIETTRSFAAQGSGTPTASDKPPESPSQTGLPKVIELWPQKAPDEPGAIGPERTRMSPRLDRKQVEVTESTQLITDVTKPTITIYRPKTNQKTSTGIIICPGGGYWDLYWQLEGEEVAAWVNSLGATGIILKYRVPRRPDEPKDQPARRPLQDAQRAVSLVRSKATELGIDPHRIGIVGFSAGGHLAIVTATRFDKRSYFSIDDIDRVSCRPDFAILVYPGYLKTKEKDELAPGLEVPAGTPPVFLAHGGADLISPPEHSVLMYLALRRAGVPAELHVYVDAAHDFGVRRSDRPCSAWTDSCATWLRSQGFLESTTKP